MQENPPIDKIDARIISYLHADGRKSYAELGQEVGLSTTAVHERVRKLMERGVIRRFSIQVDLDRAGLGFTAFVAIRHEGGPQGRDVAPRLLLMPEVVELHSVAGEFDFLAKVRARHPRALEHLLYAIKAIPGISRTVSTVVLNTEFEDQPPPLETLFDAADSKA